MVLKKHKTIIVFSLLLVLGIILSAICNRAVPTKKRPASPSQARKIVCMPPNITEIVFALDCADRIVGVSDFCNFPIEARQKEKVGGLINPNFEKLITLDPDLVITIGESEKLSQFCRQENIALLNLRIENVDELYDNIMLLGRKLACPERARQLCFDIRSELDAINAKTEGCDQPQVFFTFYRTTGSMSGLSTIGADTFISELITIAGGRNIFDDIKQLYPQISKEALIKRRPEIIIEPIDKESISEDNINQRISDWQVFGSLPAVKNNRIYFPPQEDLLIAGPRIGQAAFIIAKIIHPEVFGEL